MKPTLKQLLRWAKGKADIYVRINGTASVYNYNIEKGYSARTLYQALYKAWKAEKK